MNSGSGFLIFWNMIGTYFGGLGRLLGEMFGIVLRLVWVVFGRLLGYVEGLGGQKTNKQKPIIHQLKHIEHKVFGGGRVAVL